MASGTDELCQRPIDALSDPKIRSLDLIIEHLIHQDMAAPLGVALSHVPRGAIPQLRRCTLKALLLYGIKVAIRRDEKSRLLEMLRTLEALKAGERNSKVQMAASSSLRHQLRYQVVLHQLEACGPESARAAIDKYFAAQSKKAKTRKLRHLLIGYCRDAREDRTLGSASGVAPMSWAEFKRFSRGSLNKMLQSCAAPMLQRLAEGTMAAAAAAP